MVFRFIVLTIFFTFLYGLLGFKFYNIQVLKSPYYSQKVQARLEFSQEQTIQRGQIFFTDRNNNPIPTAINRDFPAVYAVPKEIMESDGPKPEAIAAALSPILGKPEKDLAIGLDDPKSKFRALAQKISDNQASQIKALNLKGVYISTTQIRFYPFANSAASVLGFVGVNKSNSRSVGLYGLEKKYNGSLENLEDLSLTIDRELQKQAETILGGLVEKFQASQGTIIIEEVNSGKILALANKPDFDPNEYGKYPLANFINPAVQGIYEPGSIFKPITMAIGIDRGAISSSTTFFDSGQVKLNGKTITNWDHKANGKITMTQVIEGSINTGAVFAENKIGHKNFLQALKDFGFDQLTGVDLPDEIAGDFRNLQRKEVRDVDFATASFGQGIALTPISLVNFFAALANNGVMMRPYLNASFEPEVVKRVVKPETSREVLMMMESALEKAGVAAIPYYRIAGKTGTAQLPDFQKGGYSDFYIHSYVGILPAGKPRFAILFKLDKPSATLAGATVVPAFKELAQFMINYYNLPPEKL